MAKMLFCTRPRSRASIFQRVLSILAVMPYYILLLINATNYGMIMIHEKYMASPAPKQNDMQKKTD